MKTLPNLSFLPDRLPIIFQNCINQIIIPFVIDENALFKMGTLSKAETLKKLDRFLVSRINGSGNLMFVKAIKEEVYNSFKCFISKSFSMTIPFLIITN